MYKCFKFHRFFSSLVFKICTRTRVPLKFAVSRKKVGGLSGFVFTCSLVLRISLLKKAYLTEKLTIQRIEQRFTEIPEICNFLSKTHFFLQKQSKFCFPAYNVLHSFRSCILKTDFKSEHKLMRYILSNYFLMELTWE